MLFEHKSGERVRPAAGSPNEAQLVAKAADPASDWSRAADEDDQPDPRPRGGLVKHKPAPAPAAPTQEA